MHEAETFRVKCLTRKGFCGLRPWCGGADPTATAIGLISDQPMSDMRHVDAYLVRPPCFKTARDFRCVGAECFKNADPRDRMPATLKQHRLSLAIGPMPRKLGRDRDYPSRFEPDPAHTAQARIARVGHAVTEGAVLPFDTVRGELVGQAVMRRVRFRHDQKPARILVDPVHDTRPFFAADARKVAAEMVQQRIDQCARDRARRGMDDHAGGLVDDDQVRILVNDLQRNRFGNGCDLGRLLDRDFIDLSLADARLRVSHNDPAATDRPVGQQPGQARSAEMRLLWHIAGQRLIKARRRVCADDDVDGTGHGKRRRSGR